MAATKAHAVDAYLSRPPAHAVVLIYGPDGGLVSERARKAATAFGAALDDPFATVTLDADEAAAEPGRVFEEAGTISMFGGKRLVWLRGSTQRNLARSIEPVLADPPTDALVLVEAGDLKPTSGLRKAVEKASAGMALPCYHDERAALDTMIDAEMREAGLVIDREAREHLKALLGGDRMASRSEVRKLALYAAGEETVTSEHVEAIVGDASTSAQDGFVDAVATGRAHDAENAMATLLEAGTSPVALAGALLRHFQMLHRARTAMDASGRDAASTVGAMRPPVNFRRKPDVTRALQQWRARDLQAALARLSELGFQTRVAGPLANAHLATTALALSSHAAR